MKNVHSAKKHPKLKKVLTRTAVFFALFGVAAVGSYSLLPKDNIPASFDEEEEGDFHFDETTLPGSTRLINNLQENLAGGLNISIPEFKIVIPKSVDDDDHNENVIQNAENGGIDLKLQLGDLSNTDLKIIHSINLDLDGQFAYNPSLGYNHERRLKVTLVDDVAYLGVTNINKGSEEQNIDWDLKYQISVKEDEILDNNNQVIIDTLTGGEMIYELGNLSYLFETIWNILTNEENGYDWSIPSIYDLINSSEEPTNEEPSENSSSLDLNSIMDSLNQMTESVVESKKYFTLNLPLGDSELSIGLQTDDSYNLTGIDLPAKTSNEEVASIKKNQNNELKTLVDLSLHADVKYISATNNNLIVKPSDATSYEPLEDSMDLWKKIANVAIDPSLSIKAVHEEDNVEVPGLKLTHYKRSKLPTFEAQETATINLDANMSFDSHRKFEGLKVDLGFSSEQPDGDETVMSAASVSAALDNRSTSAYKGAYLNLNNDVMKGKISKVTLDEFVARIKAELKNNSSSSEQTTNETPEESDTTEVLEKLITIVCNSFKTAKDIKSAVDNIMNSKFVKGIKAGSFEYALDLIKELKAETNKITVTLDLAYLGLPGYIQLVIGTNGNGVGLAKLTFDGVRFDAIQLDGSIVIDSLEDSTEAFFASTEGYQEMNHVLGVYDQIEDIVDKKAVSIGIDGKIMNQDSEHHDTTGVKLDGFVNASWAENDGKGTGLVSIDHVTENYSQKHNIGFDFVSKQTTTEVNEVPVTTKEKFARVQYDSNNGQLVENASNELVRADIQGNPTEIHSTNPTSAPIKAKVDFNDFSAIGSEIKGIIKDDLFVDRTSFFGQVAWSIAKPAVNSLIEKVTLSEDDPNLFGLFKKQFISSIDIGADSTVITLNKDSLGMKSDLLVTLGFADTNGVKDIYVRDDEGNNTAETSGNTYNANGLSYLGISSANIGKEDEKPLVLDLKLLLHETDDNTVFSTISDENIKEIKGVESLLSYASNGLMLGTSDTVNATTFDFGLSASVTLLQHEIELINAGLKTQISPTRNRLHAGLSLPAIKGLNAPDSDHYFRDIELEGSHDVNVYFDAHSANDQLELEDNVSEGGELLISRKSDYGRVRNVRDTLSLTGAEFGEHALEYLLQYMIGVDYRFFEPKESTNETSSSSGWNPYEDKPLHLEDCELKYTYVDGYTPEVAQAQSNAASTWEISVNLGKVLHLESILDKVSIGLTGIKGTSFSTISSLDISAKAKLGNTAEGHGVNLAEVKLGLGLRNVTVADGYVDNWSEEDSFNPAAFNSYLNYTAADVKKDTVKDIFDYNFYVGVGAYAI